MATSHHPWRRLTVATMVAFLIFVFTPPVCAERPDEGADDTAIEQFDLSGLPAKPGTAEERRIVSWVAAYRAGDIPMAVLIQGKLYLHYKQAGDADRANAALARYRDGERALDRLANIIVDMKSDPEKWTKLARSAYAPAATQPSAETVAATATFFAGRYFAKIDATLHTWEFSADGKFSHEYITGRGVGTAAGASVRNAESGRYRVIGDTAELRVAKLLTGSVTHGAGGSQGGGSQSQDEVRVLKIELKGAHGENGIVLDGVEFKPKSW